MKTFRDIVNEARKPKDFHIYLPKPASKKWALTTKAVPGAVTVSA